MLKKLSKGQQIKLTEILFGNYVSKTGQLMDLLDFIKAQNKNIQIIIFCLLIKYTDLIVFIIKKFGVLPEAENRNKISQDRLLIITQRLSERIKAKILSFNKITGIRLATEIRNFIFSLSEYDEQVVAFKIFFDSITLITNFYSLSEDTIVMSEQKFRTLCNLDSVQALHNKLLSICIASHYSDYVKTRVIMQEIRIANLTREQKTVAFVIFVEILRKFHQNPHIQKSLINIYCYEHNHPNYQTLSKKEFFTIAFSVLNEIEKMIVISATDYYKQKTQNASVLLDTMFSSDMTEKQQAVALTVFLKYEIRKEQTTTAPSKQTMPSGVPQYFYGEMPQA